MARRPWPDGVGCSTPPQRRKCRTVTLRERHQGQVQGWVLKSPKGVDGEVTLFTDETIGEKAPLPTRLLGRPIFGSHLVT
jgi:hypothetical protein